MNQQQLQDVWPELYQAAQRIYRLTPWKYLQAVNDFALSHPASGEKYYVLKPKQEKGKSLTLEFFIGDDNWYEFNAIALLTGCVPTTMIFDVPHVQLSFDRAADIASEEKKWLKAHKAYFQCSGRYPVWRNYGPFLFPGILRDADRAADLLPILKQLEKILAAVLGKKAVSMPLSDDPGVVPTFFGDDPCRADSWALHKVKPQYVQKFLPVSQNSRRQLLELPRREYALELALIRTDEAVVDEIEGNSNSEEELQPSFPLVLAGYDPADDCVLPPQFFCHPAKQSWQNQVHSLFVDMLREYGSLPAALVVWPPSLANCLQPLANQVDLEVVIEEEVLPAEFWQDFPGELVTTFRDIEPEFVKLKAILELSDGILAELNQWLEHVDAIADERFTAAETKFFHSAVKLLALRRVSMDDKHAVAWNAANVARIMTTDIASGFVASAEFLVKLPASLADLFARLASHGLLEQGDKIAVRLRKIQAQFIKASRNQEHWEDTKAAAMAAAADDELDLHDFDDVQAFLENSTDAGHDEWDSDWDDADEDYYAFCDDPDDLPHSQCPPAAAEPIPFPATCKREAPKVGRNAPCHCGSGRKYKHCCGQFER